MLSKNQAKAKSRRSFITHKELRCEIGDVEKFGGWPALHSVVHGTPLCPAACQAGPRESAIKIAHLLLYEVSLRFLLRSEASQDKTKHEPKSLRDV